MLLPVLLPLLPCPSPVDLGDAVRSATEPVLEAEGVPGAVVGVLRGGEWVVREAFGLADLESERPMTEDALFQVGSVTKPVTATLLFVLAARGEVDPDTRVVELFPDLELEGAWERVTLVHLATHTAGLPPNPHNRRDLPDSPSVMLPYSVDELMQALPATTLRSEPGASWSYSNYGYGLLGHALEVATGEELEALLREHVLDPLGMASTTVFPDDAARERMPSCYWPEDDTHTAREPWHFGEVFGFAGVHSDLDDLGRFLQAQMHPPEGFASPEALRRMHTPVVDVDAASRRTMTPGWFHQTMTGGLELLGHGGEVDGHSAVVGFAPKADLAFVVLANRGGSSAEQIARVVLEAAMRDLASR